MKTKRVNRVNSLLKEVISLVIRQNVKNKNVDELLTVTSVQVSKDLKYGKVYISVIGDEVTKKKTLLALKKSAGFIGVIASKKVCLRYFPSLQFFLDEGVNYYSKIASILNKNRICEIYDER